MKKLLFVIATLLMAGNAMAERVVTFNPADFDNVTATSYTISKDDVTIYVNLGSITDNQFRMFATTDEENPNWFSVESEIYDEGEPWEPDEMGGAPYRYGQVKSIKITCTASGDSQYGPGNISYASYLVPGEITIEDNVFFFSTEEHTRRDVYYFNLNKQVRATEIEVVLYAEEVTPPTPPTPGYPTAAPTFNGYTEDGIHAYFVEIKQTEPSTIYYRIQFPDGSWTDWAEYTEILSFTGNGKYRVEAYAVAPDKAPSTEIAYEFVVSPFTGIDEMNADKQVANVRYFNMAGQEMHQANGLTIMVTTYTDGTTNAVKVVK
jgi:hypothetical protein